MTAYRDDLEAAQLRAEDLERELTALRERNDKLEAELAGGDTAEQLANARRLAAAIEREEAERLQRQQADADARAVARRAVSRVESMPAERGDAMVVLAIISIPLLASALAQEEVAASVELAIIFGVIIGLIHHPRRVAGGDGR